MNHWDSELHGWVVNGRGMSCLRFMDRFRPVNCRHWFAASARMAQRSFLVLNCLSAAQQVATAKFIQNQWCQWWVTRCDTLKTRFKVLPVWNLVILKQTFSKNCPSPHLGIFATSKNLLRALCVRIIPGPVIVQNLHTTGSLDFLFHPWHGNRITNQKQLHCYLCSSGKTSRQSMHWYPAEWFFGPQVEEQGQHHFQRNNHRACLLLSLYKCKYIHYTIY